VGIGACSLFDIEVVNEPSGAPRLRLHDSAATLAAAKGVAGWHLTLTHTSSLAQATALALGPLAAPPAVGEPADPSG
jgi:holo-[acyl-carrier protein] synthase